MRQGKIGIAETTEFFFLSIPVFSMTITAKLHFPKVIIQLALFLLTVRLLFVFLDQFAAACHMERERMHTVCHLVIKISLR
jgi:hypothetical protein